MVRRFKMLASVAALISVLTLPVGDVWAQEFREALTSTYHNSPRLMAERARLRELDENYVQAQAAGRFTANVSASAGGNHTKTTSASFFGGLTENSDWLQPRSGQLNIIQPLYQGGRVNGLKAQARAGILAGRENLRNIEQSILLAAATAYLDVLRDEQLASIRRNNVRVLGRQKFAAQDRFDVGEGTRTDIALAASRLAAAEIGLAQADAQLAVSRAAFIRFVGHTAQGLSTPPRYKLPPTLAEAQLIGRTNNPQIVAARYNENVAKAAVHVAKSAGKPSVSLNGTVTRAHDASVNFPESRTASLALQLRIPLYSGGLNQSRVRGAKHARTRANFEIRDLEHAVDQSVSGLWAQYVAAKRSAAAARVQVSAAEVAFEGVELEQEVGTRNALDVLNAEQELLNAKLGVVNADHAQTLAAYQLLVTMGIFDSVSLQLPLTEMAGTYGRGAYNPEDNFNAVTKNAFTQKYLPQPVRGTVEEFPANAHGLAKKVGTDMLDVIEALVPGDSRRAGEILRGPLEVPGGAVLKTAKQVPDMAKTAIRAVTIDDPFDPDTANPDPEVIAPYPAPILLEPLPPREN